MSKAKEIIDVLNEKSEQDVIKELVNELGKEFEEEIRDSFNFEGRYGHFAKGKSGGFEADGIEYNWFDNEDTAEAVALEIVKTDLEDTPEIFNQDWLQGFIGVSDREAIAHEEAESQAEGEEFETDEERDEWIERKAAEIEKELEDPVQHFVHDMGVYRNVKELLDSGIVSIDVEDAAQEAVDTDGWAHFLSLYDGNYETTKGGVVYFRE